MASPTYEHSAGATDAISLNSTRSPGIVRAIICSHRRRSSGIADDDERACHGPAPKWDFIINRTSFFGDDLPFHVTVGLFCAACLSP